jgi:hypothetical protein
MCDRDEARGGWDGGKWRMWGGSRQGGGRGRGGGDGSTAESSAAMRRSNVNGKREGILCETSEKANNRQNTSNYSTKSGARKAKPKSSPTMFLSVSPANIFTRSLAIFLLLLHCSICSFVSAEILDISFTDFDLDEGKIFGDIKFRDSSPPGNLAKYHIYISTVDVASDSQAQDTLTRIPDGTRIEISYIIASCG